MIAIQHPAYLCNIFDSQLSYKPSVQWHLYTEKSNLRRLFKLPLLQVQTRYCKHKCLQKHFHSWNIFLIFIHSQVISLISLSSNGFLLLEICITLLIIYSHTYKLYLNFTIMSVWFLIFPFSCVSFMLFPIFRD